MFYPSPILPFKHYFYAHVCSCLIAIPQFTEQQLDKKLKLLLAHSHILIYPSKCTYYCGKTVINMLRICAWCIICGAVTLNLAKEKSWSVKLVDGYVLGSQVRAERCRGCQATAKLVAGNDSDKNLVLFGCNSQKCRHMLIRMNLAESPDVLLTVSHPEENIHVSAPAAAWTFHYEKLFAQTVFR